MHEYSIAASLLDLVETHAHRRNAKTVTGIHIKLGKLSGVESGLLLSAWELVREGTICSTASLEITHVEVRWTCPECGRPMHPGGLLRCDACGVPARLEEGDDLLLQTIQMEAS